MNTDQHEHTDIRHARDLAMDPERLAPSTRNAYRLAFQRCRHDPVHALKAARSKDDFFCRRAALLAVARGRIHEQLERYDKAHRMGDDRTRRNALREIRVAIAVIRTVQAVRWTGPSRTATRTAKCKRTMDPALPGDWGDRMILAAAGQLDGIVSSYVSELLILDITGCRPCELARGVIVTVFSSDQYGDVLVLGVRGGKTTETNGQPARAAAIGRHSSRAARMLFDHVAARGGEMTIGGDRTPNAIKEGIRRIGQRALGRDDITPYCYRHRQSSNLKAERLDRAIIAWALGHASDRSQEHYGTRGQGRAGASGLIGVAASREVRMHPAPPKPAASANAESSPGPSPPGP